MASMSESSTSGFASRTPFWVASALALCGIVLALNPFPFRSPVAEAVPVPAWATDATPVRQPRLEPTYRVAVYTYHCSDCHAIIAERDPASYRTAVQHTEIELEHGLNTSCFNCHHARNRDAFAGDQGVEIPWHQPQLLCAKCHGPVYRDWQHGAHGRTNGYWDAQQGAQSRRRCIECHDPHVPPFTHLAPAPGPHTLRMGTPGATGHPAPHNPLRLPGASTRIGQDDRNTQDRSDG